MTRELDRLGETGLGSQEIATIGHLIVSVICISCCLLHVHVHVYVATRLSMCQCHVHIRVAAVMLVSWNLNAVKYSC